MNPAEDGRIYRTLDDAKEVEGRTSYHNRSATIGKLALALSKAQGAMESAKKTSANPFFRSKYADLASVWDACRGPLSENELAILQDVGTVKTADGIDVVVETTLAHSSGEWKMSRLEVPCLPMVVEKGQPPRITPQSIGSAMTYARRYAVAAMVGLAQADDDGHTGSGRSEDQGPKHVPMDEGVKANHQAAIEGAGDADQLKEAYFAALKASEEDEESKRFFIELTNAMKKKLPPAVKGKAKRDPGQEG